MYKGIPQLEYMRQIMIDQVCSLNKLIKGRQITRKFEGLMETNFRIEHMVE